VLFRPFLCHTAQQKLAANFAKNHQLAQIEIGQSLQLDMVRTRAAEQRREGESTHVQHRRCVFASSSTPHTPPRSFSMRTHGPSNLWSNMYAATRRAHIVEPNSGR
jgi:hypothetical protein